MPKKAEFEYYKNIGQAGIDFSANKPFSDRVNAGALLNSIAAIYTVIHNHYGEAPLRIIDLGCGTGWSSNLFALSGHEVMGVDLSKDAIKEAKKKFQRPNLSYKALNYEELNKTGTFDVAIFIDSLHHADDEVKVLKNVRQILDKGGICIVCEPGKGHSTSPDALEAIRLYGVNERDMPPSVIKAAAKKAGFFKHEVFTHPSYAQKSAYKKFNSGKKKLINTKIGRLTSVAYANTLGKTREGLVVLYK